MAAACGGSTGREGLDDLAGDGPLDATTADAATFDVGIAYVDRQLPEAGLTDAPREAGPSYPSCPPFLPVVDGTPVEAGLENDQIPTDWDDAGNVVQARDGSVCATYPWLGTADADCVTSNCTGYGMGSSSEYSVLPPCNWLADAGVARQGSRAGAPRYDVCMELYACMIGTGCALRSVSTCLCGDAGTLSCDGGGPCATEELAALEYRADDINDALKNFTDTTNGAGRLNQVFQCGISNTCFAGDAGHP
jgi:hypothetical protein